MRSCCARMTVTVWSRPRPSYSLIATGTIVAPPCALERESAERTVHLVPVDATLYNRQKRTNCPKQYLYVSLKRSLFDRHAASRANEARSCPTVAAKEALWEVGTDAWCSTRRRARARMRHVWRALVHTTFSSVSFKCSATIKTASSPCCGKARERPPARGRGARGARSRGGGGGGARGGGGA